MRNIIMIFSLFTFTLISFSFGQASWEYLYEIPDRQLGFDIVKCESEGFLISAISYDPDSSMYHTMLLRINDTGDTIWTRTYNDHRLITDYSPLIQLPCGNFVNGGLIIQESSGEQTGQVKCLDTLGNIIWTKDFVNYNILDISSDSDEIILLIQAGDTVKIFALSSTGDSLWVKNYGTHYVDAYHPYDIDRCFDGGYVFVGSYSGSDGEPQCFIMRLDDNGDSLWFSHYRIPWDVQFNAVSQCLDSGFVCVGSCMPAANPQGLVVRYSKTGARLWERRYGLGYDPEMWNFSFEDVIVDSSGGFFITGRHPVDAYESWILRLNESGDTLWSAEFDEVSNLYSIIHDGNGGYIAAGQSYDDVVVAGVIEGQSIATVLPNGGEIWEIGTVHNVFWESDGISNVNIQYSTDGGESWLEIESSIPNSEHYEWTIPSTPSNNCLLKVYDATNPSVFDISDEPFEITSSSPSPEITIISPNGGEIWISGSEQPILWNSTGVGSVSIDYSINSGMEWLPIVASTFSDGFFDWVIPVHNSTHCLVRITDIDMPSVSDTSETEFEIDNTSPSIILTYPTEGDTLLIDSTITITWIYDEIDDTIFQVLYSLDDGATFPYFEGLVEGSSYEWTVPDSITDVCRIKICTLDSTTGSEKGTFSSMDGEPVAEVISPPLPIRHSLDIENLRKPSVFSLTINPNPFNSSCAITVSVGTKVNIYDLQGNVVYDYCRRGLPTSIDCRRDSQTSKGNSSENRHWEMSFTSRTVIWTPDKNTSSGIYFVKATMNDGQTITRRIVYLK